MSSLNKLTAMISTPLAFTINIDAWAKGVQLFSPFFTMLISMLSVISLIIIIRTNINKNRDLKLMERIHELELKNLDKK